VNPTSNTRWLIVNADDFGQSRAINRGVIAAHERGIVTSASLMVRWPASREAADYARTHLELSLGLHVDFGEWSYRDHEWVPIYVVASLTDHRLASREAAGQLDKFRELVGAEPTHLDSHQHVHRDEPLRSVLSEMARQLGVPLRHADPRIRYDGSFYGQSGHGYPVPEAISRAALTRLIGRLPVGVTELGCHPGERGDELETMYRDERAREVRALCDRSTRAAIESSGARLCSFRDVAGAERRL
jgi:chitin disaccharide deacetylase